MVSGSFIVGGDGRQAALFKPFAPLLLLLHWLLSWEKVTGPLIHPPSLTVGVEHFTTVLPPHFSKGLCPYNV